MDFPCVSDLSAQLLSKCSFTALPSSFLLFGLIFSVSYDSRLTLFSGNQWLPADYLELLLAERSE